LIVFPNPVNNKFQFKYDENLEELISIIIYPITGGGGKLIEKSDNQINVREMDSVVYFINFKFKKNSIVKRIIVSK
jgi:hypothetical protein